MKNRLNPLVVSLIVIGSPAITRADIYDWNGLTTGGAGGVNETWDTTTANWTGVGTVWPAVSTLDDDAVFAGTAGTVTVSGGVTANDLTFSTAGYTLTSGTITLSGTSSPVITNAVTAEIASSISGSAGFTKRSAGTLVLSGANSLSGSLIAGIAQNTDPSPATVNDGILRLANSRAAGTSTIVINGGYQRGRVELTGGISVSNAITLQGRQSISFPAITNLSGDNSLSGGITVQANGARLIFNTVAGSLTVSGAAMTGSASRTLVLRGAGSGEFAKPVTSAVVSVVDKQDAGTWTISGASTYTGATTVNGGRLIVTSSTGLGTGATANTSVALGATLDYAAKTDAPLAIGGTLAITGGTGTSIGGSIGSTTTSASINVTGNATISNAAHSVNLYGIPGVSATTGIYTLISGAAGSSLSPVTAPTLGKVYNNATFTVGALSRTATTLGVSITAATPLANAYWTGGLSGSPNVWSVSDGTATSNWAASAGGPAQALVPGPTTNVIVSATAPTLAPAATVLGANMSINSLTIADTVNGLGLNSDNCTLTLGAGGITMNSAVPASTIATKVALGAAQTWGNNSTNPLTISGIISGTSPLTTSGTGTVALSGTNSYTGDTRVASGTLAVANLNALATSTLDMNASDAGSVAFTVAGTNTYNIGGLSGSRAINAGGNTLSIGAKNVATEFSGELSNGSLTKVGTNTLTLSGTSTFTGNVIVNAGRLTIASSGALGTGVKGLNMQGTSRSVYLKGGITLPAGITFNLSSNSGDGLGLNNESDNNTILGAVNISTGNPVLNISSAAGALTISGNVTLTATARPLILGGASTADNTISGVIGSNSEEVLPVTKQGTGKWIFAGNNTYTGATTLSDGTLLVNGSTAADSAVAVNGGVLGGTGTVNGPVTVAALGTVAPGASTGALSTGPADFSAGGTLAIEINDASTPKVDVLNVSGNLNVTDAKLNIVATGTPGQASYVIATATSITGTFPPANVTGLPAGYTLEYTSTEIKLTGTATNTYTNWLTANPPATGFMTDSDNDGVSNGIENVLGTNPNVYSAGLTAVSATATTATFKHTLNATIASDVSYSYQWSTDLVEWKASGEANTGGTTATITPSAPVSGVVTVTTSITSGPSAKLFTRIRTTKP